MLLFSILTVKLYNKPTLITAKPYTELLHFALVVDDAKCIVVTPVCVCVCVCLSVCVSVRGRMPTLLHGPACNVRAW